MPKIYWRIAGLLILIQTVCGGQTSAVDSIKSPESASELAPAALPAPGSRELNASTYSAAPGVSWGGLLRQSFSFLVLEEGFRFLTEKGARHTHKPFFTGYVDSVANLHGWGDGDPFLVNYVGHPMQGAVSGFIWIQNDGRYRGMEFGRNRDYWKSRLRAAAFAWVYSEASEIGPISEASIGATQSFYPQQGFADHVITPTIGLGWIIAEDMIDTWVIKKFEAHTGNSVLKVLLRGALNPSRSFANVIGGKVPWSRDTRPGFFSRNQAYLESRTFRPVTVSGGSSSTSEPAAVAPFEFSVLTLFQQSSNGGPCIGGGAAGSFRWAAEWQLTVEVTGCNMTGTGPNLSGDVLNYMVGPRWTPLPANHWSPYMQLLIGGQKISREETDPVAKAAVAESYRQANKVLDFSSRDLYASDSGTNAFAVKLGAGVDLKLRSALAVRMIGVDYLYSPIHRAEFQLTAGLLLRLGTW